MNSVTLESGINATLSQLLLLSGNGVPVYWLRRPANTDNAVVYRVISRAEINTNLARSGIDRDLVSIHVYHTDPDQGVALAKLIKDSLTEFHGELNGYPVQRIAFSGGHDAPLPDEVGQIQYQFVRDFTFYH